jgi:hypothetical protein
MGAWSLPGAERYMVHQHGIQGAIEHYTHRAFGNVDNIRSGEFNALWTGRIDHFADTYSAALADTVINATSKDSARRLTAVVRSNVRGMRSHAPQLPARVALTRRTHPPSHLPRRRHIARSSGLFGAHKARSSIPCTARNRGEPREAEEGRARARRRLEPALTIPPTDRASAIGNERLTARS